MNTLSILIVNNLNIERWFFKIDDESEGRGIAYFNVDSVKFLKRLRK